MLAGVDEAGRGPLAGPVIAAAVILDSEKPIAGLKDSKQLSPIARDRLYDEILANSIAYGIGRAEVSEIDELNILQATLLAMRRAVLSLTVFPTLVLVDGNQIPSIPFEVKAIVAGDSKIQAISAASILAKVSRDREMQALDQQYPGYGLAQHKGYPTRQHLQALGKLGASKIHRLSFAPVRELVLGQQ